MYMHEERAGNAPQKNHSNNMSHYKHFENVCVTTENQFSG